LKNHKSLIRVRREAERVEVERTGKGKKGKRRREALIFKMKEELS
jgi:hypothetical protein